MGLFLIQRSSTPLYPAASTSDVSREPVVQYLVQLCWQLILIFSIPLHYIKAGEMHPLPLVLYSAKLYTPTAALTPTAAPHRYTSLMHTPPHHVIPSVNQVE